MNKIYAGLALFVVLLIAIYFVFTTDKAQAPSVATSTAQSAQAKVFSWSLEDAGTDESIGAPRTKISLVADGVAYDAGTYNGSCQTITANGGVDGKGLLTGEIAGVQCWFAGGGDEIGIFNEDGALVLKHGFLDEPQGDGTGGTRGGFTAILSL